MVQVMQELLTAGHPNALYGAATVMEEVGLRGATTSVELVNPDVRSSWSPTSRRRARHQRGRVRDRDGQGSIVLMYDARMIPNLRLRDLVMDTAQELGQPLQVSIMEGGATDGASIHLHRLGVPTVVLAVPARHNPLA